MAEAWIAALRSMTSRRDIGDFSFGERLILKNNWLMLAVTLAIQAMVSLALLTLPVMAPVVADALGVSSVYVGVYVAIVYLGVVLGPPLFGALSGLFGSYRAGYAALAVPTLVCCALLLRQKKSLMAAAE